MIKITLQFCMREVLIDEIKLVALYGHTCFTANSNDGRTKKMAHFWEHVISTR